MKWLIDLVASNPVASVPVLIWVSSVLVVGVSAQPLGRYLPGQIVKCGSDLVAVSLAIYVGAACDVRSKFHQIAGEEQIVAFLVYGVVVLIGYLFVQRMTDRLSSLPMAPLATVQQRVRWGAEVGLAHAIGVLLLVWVWKLT